MLNMLQWKGIESSVNKVWRGEGGWGLKSRLYCDFGIDFKDRLNGKIWGESRSHHRKAKTAIKSFKDNWYKEFLPNKFHSYWFGQKMCFNLSLFLFVRYINLTDKKIPLSYWQHMPSTLHIEHTSCPTHTHAHAQTHTHTHTHSIAHTSI